MDVVKHGKQSDSQRKVTGPRVRIWTRLSPMYIFRAFRDTYVRGCVTFGNSSKVNAIVHSAAFQISCNENSFSRSSSQSVRDKVADAQELLELSAKFSREVSEQESVQSGRKHLTAVISTSNGMTLADLQGYASASPSPGRSPLRASNRVSKLKLTDIQGHSGPLRARPSFDTVPESEQYTEPRTSGFAITRAASERLRPLSRYTSTSPVRNKPLSPLTGMSTLREQPRKSDDLPRASSRRPERFRSMPSAASMRRSAAPVDDFFRPRSGKSANKPNPYREYDTRLPSPPPTV